jgi:hypothetical protein
MAPVILIRRPDSDFAAMPLRHQDARSIRHRAIARGIRHGTFYFLGFAKSAQPKG